jgi:hypothetical protein
MQPIKIRFFFSPKILRLSKRKNASMVHHNKARRKNKGRSARPPAPTQGQIL